MNKTLALLCVLCMLAFSSYAQLNIGVSGVATEDFSTFDGSGFAPLPGLGELDSDAWAITGFSDGNLPFGGTATSGDYARGTDFGFVSTGGIYKLDNGPSFQGLYIQPGGSDFTPGTITLKVCNQSGGTLTNPAVAYEIYFLNDRDRANSLNFSYSTDDITYTPVASLDFTTPGTGDPEPPTEKVSRSTALPISVNNLACFYLRWTSDDVSGSGERDEMGIGQIMVGDLCRPDLIPPEFDFCPADISMSNDPGKCGAIVTYTAPTAIDICGNPTIQLIAGQASGTLFGEGDTEVIYEATDGAGNTSTCVFDVTIEDLEGPSISCPPNVTAFNDQGECGAVVTYADPTVSDNCTTIIPELVAGLPSGSLFPVGTTVVTYDALDDYENSDECSFNVTVIDSAPPKINCPADIVRMITSGCADVVNYEVTATDQCVRAPTTMPGLGDIALTGFRSDADDSISFVTFVELGVGTEIKFTDEGWLGAGGFRGTGEGDLLWTATSVVPAGTEVLLRTQVGILAASTGTLTVEEAGFGLSTNGDQVFAYVGSEPTAGDESGFIAALQVNGFGWQSDATSSNESALPSVFTNGENAVSVFEADNVWYDCSTTSGSITAVRQAINDRSNWDFSSSSSKLNSGCDITLPELTLSLISGINSGGTFPVGVTTNTWMATDPSGNTDECTFTITVKEDCDPLPAGMSNFDVGNTGNVVGQVCYDATTKTYEIKTSGSGIGGNNDGVHFVPITSSSLTMDIIARVVKHPTNTYQDMIGVMIRGMGGSNAANVSTLISGDNKTVMTTRAVTGHFAVGTNGPVLPGPLWPGPTYWVRLQRIGFSFTASVSPDGITWTTIATKSAFIAGAYQVGLCATARTPGQIVHYTVDNVTINGTAYRLGEDGLEPMAVTAFPNPTRGGLNVNIDITEPTHVRLALQNALGQQLIIEEFDVEYAGLMEHRIEMGDLSAGVYLLEVSVGDKQRTLKIVKD